MVWCQPTPSEHDEHQPSAIVAAGRLQAVHLIAELRELGHKLAVGWVGKPCAESDISIVDCYLSAAGDTGRAVV